MSHGQYLAQANQLITLEGHWEQVRINQEIVEAALAAGAIKAFSSAGVVDTDRAIYDQLAADSDARLFKEKWRELGACKNLPHGYMCPPNPLEKRRLPDGKFQSVYTKEERAEIRERVKKLKGICAGCKVERICLENALSEDVDSQCGVAGGLSQSERVAILRPRKKSPAKQKAA